MNPTREELLFRLALTKPAADRTAPHQRLLLDFLADVAGQIGVERVEGVPLLCVNLGQQPEAQPAIEVDIAVQIGGVEREELARRKNE